MSGHPPFHQINSEDHSGLIVVIAYCMLSITILTVILRTLVALHLKRPQGVDDLLNLFAFLFSIIQTIIIQKSADSGLGKRRINLSTKDFDHLSQLFYASQFFFILALGFSKLGVAILINRLSPDRTIIVGARVSQVAILVFMAFSIFAIAFQCQSPFWEITPSKCVGNGSLFYVIGAMNIITDIPLTFLPIIMLMSVQMPLSRRILVMASFLTRLVPIITTIISLAYLPGYLNASDSSWSILSYATINELVMFLSIIAGCVPSLHHFLSNLSAAGFDAAVTDTQIELSKLSGSGSGKHGFLFSRGDKTPFGSRYGHNSKGATMTSRVTSGTRQSKHAQTTGSSSRRLSSGESTRTLTKGVVRTMDFKVEVENHRLSSSAGDSIHAI